MKRIWRMAGVGLLVASVGAQVLADERDGAPGPGPGQRPQGGGQHERGPQGGGRPENNQPRPENQRIERGGPNGGGQWQGRAPGNEPGRPAPPSTQLPIQGRPDTVRQTEEPRQGYYRDIPRRNDDNRHWEAGGPGSRPGFNGRPDDNRWPGRPDGHGNGWGPGPQHRPGYVIDRFPDRNYRVPYRGQDYFFSGGYWYRPQGPRYVVVTPPYGIRVQYLPDYAREVRVGGSLLFLAAGAYYAYEESTRQYVVVQPPAEAPPPPPPPQGEGYDVVAYPANGQSPAQVQQDGYDCYRWAVQQSGFDAG